MFEHPVRVLVVGGGLAGHAAALSAAHVGATVLLVEKQPEFGGSSVLAGGGLAFAGTDLQRARGIEDSAADLEHDLLVASKGAGDPDIIAVYAREQAAVYQWLCAQGAVFDLMDGNERLHTMPPGALVELLHARVLDEPQIVYRSSGPVTRLRFGDGRVIGAELADGTEVASDAVVLATGGFARNAELVARLAPQCAGAVAMGGLGNDGDGLVMAMDLGARLAGMEHVEASFGATMTADGAPRLLYAHSDGAVIVNARGERFADEDADIKALGRAVARQPGAMAYQVFDQSVMERSRKVPATRDFARAHRDGLLTQAPTLSELAAAIDVPERALAAAARELAKPPFYAFPCRPGLSSTYGGVRVDASMRVLGEHQQPLGGLYAAGELVGGFHGAGYLVGTALGKAAVFGHVAGREAAVESSARLEGEEMAQPDNVPSSGLPETTTYTRVQRGLNRTR
jgi:fumarate reductase flavoprotein subunit